jgi:hypothetical protein
MDELRQDESRRRASGSRRELLAGATGAVAALAAGAVVKAAPAQAAQGSAVIEGADNNGATARTAVFTIGNSEWGVLADPNSSGLGSLGVYGHGQDFGVRGEADSAGSGSGVLGVGAGTGYGVIGGGGSINGGGVFGRGVGEGQGVFGVGGGNKGSGVAGAGGTDGDGVTGLAFGTGNGVSGYGGGTNGSGVLGQGGGNGAGLLGIAFGTGPAVHGRGPAAGVGVLAENSDGGTALKVTGPAVFSRSGILAIAAGSSSATKTRVPLSAGSLVLATLQQDRAGVYVRSAVPNIAKHSFTIQLNKAVTKATTVAWFIVN